MAASDTISTWSRFYHTLNSEAARLRELMKEAGLDSPSPKVDPTRPVRADQNGQQDNCTTKTAAEKDRL